MRSCLLLLLRLFPYRRRRSNGLTHRSRQNENQEELKTATRLCTRSPRKRGEGREVVNCSSVGARNGAMLVCSWILFPRTAERQPARLKSWVRPSALSSPAHRLTLLQCRSVFLLSRPTRLRGSIGHVPGSNQRDSRIWSRISLNLAQE